jgi:hypothetical protein
MRQGRQRKGHEKSLAAPAQKMLFPLVAMPKNNPPYRNKAVDYEALDAIFWRPK